MTADKTPSVNWFVIAILKFIVALVLVGLLFGCVIFMFMAIIAQAA